MSKWEERCYSDGIPDEVPAKLATSLRVPSYKFIAIALLKNDLTLKSLGFSGKHSDWHNILKNEKTKKDSKQISLI